MWPVAELHLHIEGTLEADLLIELARRNDVALPTWDPDELTRRYDHFADLQSFLDIHYANLRVLRSERDFYDLATAYLGRAATAGVRRAEIFFDPQTHLGHGVRLEEILGGLTAALADARADSGISADLIMCFLRDLGPEAAEEMFRLALPHRESFIGIGLDSTEVGYPPSLFEKVYAMAAAEGLHRVAHAGEEAGPDYVWQAIDLLGVERVDHGIRSMEDASLIDRLRADRIPLTVCPLSNVCLNAVPSLAEHPLPAMLANDLVATISSDDPAYFGGQVDDNFAALRNQLGLSAEQLARLAVNSFEACFVDDEAQRHLWIEAANAELARQTARG